MTIASELNDLGDNIRSAYWAIEDRGGTIPARKTTENLKTSILSIPSSGGGAVDIVTYYITDSVTQWPWGSAWANQNHALYNLSFSGNSGSFVIADPDNARLVDPTEIAGHFSNGDIIRLIPNFRMSNLNTIETGTMLNFYYDLSKSQDRAVFGIFTAMQIDTSGSPVNYPFRTLAMRSQYKVAYGNNISYIYEAAAA